MNERGSVSLLVILMATALLAFAGLVIDGAAGLAAASRASDVAEDAARAGAQAGSVPGPSGVVSLDAGRARQAATAWLADEGIAPGDATISVAPDGVSVVVRLQHRTGLLRLAGVEHFDVEGDALARPAIGITREER
jgi:hypothetical protein